MQRDTVNAEKCQDVCKQHREDVPRTELLMIIGPDHRGEADEQAISFAQRC